ncbi:UbiD family decarboxylase [Salinigranum sp. GCM10025319]|uniref:UbiD family decarboxylase n=1 Tax=Salinigranum sp. GCM10025319 TaxID=3252687 RepID=UPI003611E526
MVQREYPDMWEHIQKLKDNDLVVEVDRPINKDTELHPLVRWQYRGGLSENERKAFLFTDLHDSKGREFDTPVVVGALAGNPEIYGLGINSAPEKIHEKWDDAIENPVDPVEIDSAPVHEVVREGDDLEEPGQGLDGIPVPISTPGWDNAPYTTMSAMVTQDPDSGVRNMGIYRAQLKSRNRTGIFSYAGHGLFDHWHKMKERGEPLPVAVCVSAPPCVAYTSAQTLPADVDELAVAGGLVGSPIREVEAKTVPLSVPADADIIFEGYVRSDVLEPEGPFGESHGYLAMKEYGLVFELTAITMRSEPLYTSIISQVTPSESCTLKKVAMEPLYYNYLTKTCSISTVAGVELHEPLTNLREVMIVQMKKHADTSEVWRALTSTISLRPAHGKIVIAVDEDIDPKNLDAVVWAMSYRSNPAEDVQIVNKRSKGHYPGISEHGLSNDAALLWDATLKEALPPVSLPKREYMENAREIWEELGLPELDPESPWYGYALDVGVWNDELEQEAQLAVESEYFETGANDVDKRVSTDNVNVNDVYEWDE